MTEAAVETSPSPPSEKKRMGRPPGVKNRIKPPIDEIDGLRLHDSKNTANGEPRWSHPLFPWDRKTPEQMERYDRTDAKLGTPEVLTLEKFTGGAFVSLPIDFSPDDLDSEATLTKYFGGGRYRLKAWTPVAKTDGSVGRQCTRMREDMLAGPSRNLNAAVHKWRMDHPSDMDEEDETEEEDEEDEEDDESDDESSANAISAALASQQKMFETMLRQQRADFQQQLAAVASLAQTKITLSEQAHKERASQQQSFFEAMIRLTKERAAQAVAPPPPPPADPLAALTKAVASFELLDRLKGKLGPGGTEAETSVLKEIKDLVKSGMQTAAEVYMSNQEQAARLEAAKAGVQLPDPPPDDDDDDEEEEDEEEGGSDGETQDGDGGTAAGQG